MDAAYQIDCTPPAGQAASQATIRFVAPLPPSNYAAISESVLDLLGQGYQRWVVDLRKLQRCDSSTLGALVSLHLMIQKQGGRVAFVVQADSYLHNEFAQTKLDRLLTIRTADPCS